MKTCYRSVGRRLQPDDVERSLIKLNAFSSQRSHRYYLDLQDIISIDKYQSQLMAGHSVQYSAVLRFGGATLNKGGAAQAASAVRTVQY
jgi:hypothetical protein